MQQHVESVRKLAEELRDKSGGRLRQDSGGEESWVVDEVTSLILSPPEFPDLTSEIGEYTRMARRIATEVERHEDPGKTEADIDTRLLRASYHLVNAARESREFSSRKGANIRSPNNIAEHKRQWERHEEAVSRELEAIKAADRAVPSGSNLE